MQRSIAIFLLAFLLVGGQRRAWIPLRTDDGEWLSVKEILKGEEYWIHPSTIVESVHLCSRCLNGTWILRIRFWQEKDLATARDCLQRQGWCETDDKCRVLPFQAATVSLRDVVGRWEPITPRVSLYGILPPTQDFAVRYSPSSATPPLIDDSTICRHLTTLEIDFTVDHNTSSARNGVKLVFTKHDMDWARRLMKRRQIPSKGLIDQVTLRQFIVKLLQLKNKVINTRLDATSELIRRIQRHLTIGSVRYHQQLKNILPKGQRPNIGEVLYILRPIKDNDKFSINIWLEDRQLLSFTVSTRPAVKISKNASTLSPSTVDTKSKKIESKSRQAITLLQRQMTHLARILREAHILQSVNINLTAVDDCNDVQTRGLKAGVYFLRSLNRPVRCTKKGELVVLRRTSNNLNFNVSWSMYEVGVGDVRKGDFFIGLKALAKYSNADDICMKLVLAPWKLNTPIREAIYDTFRVSPKQQNYRLSYVHFSGTVLFDILNVMNGQSFSTFDRDNDQFVGNCASRFGGGNWFNSCFKGHIFGPYKKDASSGMCSQGMAASQGDMCSPLSAVRMLLKRKVDTKESLQVVFSRIAKTSQSPCPTKLHTFTVPTTGLYVFTIGGAPGGRSPSKRTRPGGRGAKVRAKFLLQKGTEIGVSAGCQGAYGSAAGDGGDASWAFLRSNRVLLAVAGGGGGAGWAHGSGGNKDYPPLAGMPGRATSDGGDAWWRPGCSYSGDALSILLRKIDNSRRAKGWQDLRERFLTQPSATFTSGGASAGDNTGGDGGGYEGGLQHRECGYSGGGGGGSFCNATEAASCALFEGGNTRPQGYVIIERQRCF